MAELNGVNGASFNQGFGQASNANTLPDQPPVSVFSQSTNGREIRNQREDFNVYGKDIENFSKFKGNDKHDAMRMTNTAANDVKTAYMQLQHEFPDVSLEFPPMPDPKTCGKKREGFFTYQQQLEDWKDMALTQIANQRETCVQDQINVAKNEIMQNDNNNAEFNAGVTVAATEILADKVDERVTQAEEKINANTDRQARNIEGTVRKEGKLTRAMNAYEEMKTRDVVAEEGAFTRNTVRFEGDITRDTVENEAQVTRDTVRDEANATRATVQNEGHATRETVRKEADNIIDTLDPLGTNRAVKGARDAISDNSGAIIGGIAGTVMPGLAGPAIRLGHEADVQRRNQDEPDVDR